MGIQLIIVFLKLLGHNRHSLYGRGKQWQRADVERLLHFMVMHDYLDEELVVTRYESVVAYVRIGPKAKELLSGEEQVINLFSLVSYSVASHHCCFFSFKVQFPVSKVSKG